MSVDQSPTAPKVVPLSKPPEADDNRQRSMARPQKRRRKWLALSFMFCVIWPILAGSIYFAHFASDRYMAGAGFAVRGVNAGGGLDSIGALTGLASTGSTTSDSYIVLKYLKSRGLLERLQEDFALRAAFDADTIDPLSRLQPTPSIEGLVSYWSGMISTSFDATSGIITFEVEAFTAEDAHIIAELVLKYTDELVNELSEAARQDSVRFAETEVTRAEERLREALQQIRAFRAQEQSINPAATAQLDIELLSELEGRLIDLRARIASIRDSLDENAPSLLALRRQVEAVEMQIAERSAGIGATGTQGELSNLTISDQLALFETLEVEKAFAQQAYQSALSSLEQARAEADRQQRYLAVFSHPALPQEAAYPRRLQSIAMMSIIVISIWGIATLMVYSVRDHLS